LHSGLMKFYRVSGVRVFSRRTYSLQLSGCLPNYSTPEFRLGGFSDGID
jgi:hypothetical protein